MAGNCWFCSGGKIRAKGCVPFTDIRKFKCSECGKEYSMQADDNLTKVRIVITKCAGCSFCRFVGRQKPDSYCSMHDCHAFREPKEIPDINEIAPFCPLLPPGVCRGL